MLKWLCGIVLIIGAIVSVAYKEHYAREEYQAQSEKDCMSLAVSPEEQHACAKEAQNRKDYAPWWYMLVEWPEGITTWAIIGTGFVIAWQSNETRKAAENAGKALVFQQETLRPRLKINEFVNDVLHEAVVAGDWVIVNMKISNSGGWPAYGVIADTWIEFVWGTPPYKFSPEAKYARADLRLNVHTGGPTGFELPLGRKLTDEERYAMGHANGTVCFRIKLTYQALSGEVHTDEAWSVGLGGMRSIAEYSSET